MRKNILLIVMILLLCGCGSDNKKVVEEENTENVVIDDQRYYDFAISFFEDVIGGRYGNLTIKYDICDNSFVQASDIQSYYLGTKYKDIAGCIDAVIEDVTVIDNGSNIKAVVNVKKGSASSSEYTVILTENEDGDVKADTNGMLLNWYVKVPTETILYINGGYINNRFIYDTVDNYDIYNLYVVRGIEKTFSVRSDMYQTKDIKMTPQYGDMEDITSLDELYPIVNEEYTQDIIESIGQMWTEMYDIYQSGDNQGLSRYICSYDEETESFIQNYFDQLTKENGFVEYSDFTIDSVAYDQNEKIYLLGNDIVNIPFTIKVSYNSNTNGKITDEIETNAVIVSVNDEYMFYDVANDGLFMVIFTK